MALEKLLPIYGCAAKRPSAARRSALEFGALTSRGLLEYSGNDLGVDRRKCPKGSDEQCRPTRSAWLTA
jgi:hypothetical protein